MTIFRQPAVSGLFYPSEKKELEDQILSFLKKSKEGRLGKAKDFNCSACGNCLFVSNSGFWF